MRTVGLGTPIRGAAASGAASWQGSVKDKDLTAPPGSPVLGDRYIVASPATGAWSGEENSIAEWDGSAWIFDTPVGGWTVWIDDESEIYVFNGSSWGQESFGPHAASHKGGGGDVIANANSSLAGLMSSAMYTKLDILSMQGVDGKTLGNEYQAGADGFLTVFIDAPGQESVFEIREGDSSPPSNLVGIIRTSDYQYGATATVPIQKDHYFQVERTLGTATPTIHWRPMA